MLPLSVVHTVPLGCGGALHMHAAAEAFAQEILHPALHGICLHGRDRDQSVCWLSPAEQRDPSLAFCAPASIQAICDSIPNARVRNASYLCDTHSSLFTSCVTRLFSIAKAAAERIAALHLIAFTKSSFCKPRNYSSKSERI